MNTIKNIAVLLTCHNRKEKTLFCLNALYNCIVPENYVLEVFLVDDGSTDGTAQAVKENFSQVTIIKGNGNLYWNQGMRLAWETAAKTKEYDFYLWLNDDTILIKNSVELLLNKSELIGSKQILIGATISNNSIDVTYSGYKNYNRKLCPNGDWQECDYFNGNIVLVPKKVFKSVGYLDPKFQHALGDFDYGRRAVKLGFINLLAPESLGHCETNEIKPVWRDLKIPLFKRLKYLYSPLGNDPREFFIIDNRENGLIKAIFHYFTIHLRAIFPMLWR